VYHVYIVECNDGSFYTGYTTDVGRRVAEHNAGRGAKYTLGRRPVELRHVETFESKSAAMSREYEIKQFTRREKERLVRESDDASTAHTAGEDAGVDDSAAEDGANGPVRQPTD
jgi:putative endonuclease